jgi:hypothetical protein
VHATFEVKRISDQIYLNVPFFLWADVVQCFMMPNCAFLCSCKHAQFVCCVGVYIFLQELFPWLENHYFIFYEQAEKRKQEDELKQIKQLEERFERVKVDFLN